VRGERVHFHLRDYRRQPGPFDRIVSVGMFERVGALSPAAAAPSSDILC
jgi:cyclopropane fatty-acyl-phospholipid synthase-like methyltransferase